MLRGDVCEAFDCADAPAAVIYPIVLLLIVAAYGACVRIATVLDGCLEGGLRGCLSQCLNQCLNGCLNGSAVFVRDLCDPRRPIQRWAHNRKVGKAKKWDSVLPV